MPKKEYALPPLQILLNFFWRSKPLKTCYSSAKTGHLEARFPVEHFEVPRFWLLSESLQQPEPLARQRLQHVPKLQAQQEGSHLMYRLLRFPGQRVEVLLAVGGGLQHQQQL